MTTPIMNVLDIAQQPPFVVGRQELDRFCRAITSLYEQQTKDVREAFLTDDCLSLILRHSMYGGTPKAKIQIIERNEQIQGCIEEITRLLLSVADSLNTRLPESFIEQCRNATEESASRFYEIIREAYITPAWGAPPATQETPKEWLQGKPKEVLEEAVNSGLAEKKEDGYCWIVGNKEKGWRTGLYGYFVLMVCEQLGWLTGKAKRIPWGKFQPIFKNHGEILGTAKQTVDDFKKGDRVPTLYYKVDDLINKVFGVELSPTPKPL